MANISHSVIREVLFRCSYFSLIIIIFLFLAAPGSLRDLSSPTRDRTQAPCSGSAEF